VDWRDHENCRGASYSKHHELNTLGGPNKVAALMSVKRRKGPKLAGQILEHYGEDASEQSGHILAVAREARMAVTDDIYKCHLVL
jgi:hypothetical protein